MAKKDKNIYNIQNMNCEIDYDKLAKAIVKAQREAEKQEKEPTNSKVKITFIDFVKKVIEIFKGKSDTKGEMTKGMFAIVNSIAFNILAWLTLASSVIGIVFIFYAGFQMQWSISVAISNLLMLLLILLVSIALFMIAIILKGASNEIEKEQDKNFLVAVFSGLMATMAFVVSLVALFKG